MGFGMEEEKAVENDIIFLVCIFLLCFLKNNNTDSCVIFVNFEMGNKIAINI